MSHSSCLITGCNFLDVENKRWIHGDLHQLLDSLIFNATGCEWVACDETPFPPDDMGCLCHAFYEKNNVIVFPLPLTVFNEAAHNYLVGKVRDEEKQIITFGGVH